MGVFFPLFFLLVKEICMLFTHISISTQTHTHTHTTDTHAHAAGSGVEESARGEEGILQWKTPWNFQYIKIEVRCVFSLLHSNVKCQRQINVTAQQTCLPLFPSPLPLQHSHWCVCVCVCAVKPPSGRTWCVAMMHQYRTEHRLLYSINVDSSCCPIVLLLLLLLYIVCPVCCPKSNCFPCPFC